ncbi:uncharacterized protein LODBEIA_P53040 [Lodderomyces beijingensis]|uniref:Gfd2/YDR514C-like C-terminal domain-containing protein n=1 Tax=Lodderomyces beijingensis TaxID=1775926 RepID=A0ABP0ZSG8_9ASCO
MTRNKNKNSKRQLFRKQKIVPEDRELALERFRGIYEALDSDTSPKLLPLSHNEQQISSLLQTIVDSYAAAQETEWKKNPYISRTGTRNALLSTIRDVFTRSAILFSLDVEAWERDANVVTEIGLAIYDPTRGLSRGLHGAVFEITPTIKQLHIRIKEHCDLTNGAYVPNHVDKFNGGTTLLLSKYEAAVFLQSMIDYFFDEEEKEEGEAVDVNCKNKRHKNTYLVGHDIQGDVKWLSNMGIEFPAKYSCIDTMKLMRISHGKPSLGLARSLQFCDISHNFLHNAGNDAYYTLLLALKLCDPYSRLSKNLDVFVGKEMTAEEIELKKAEKEGKRMARIARRQGKIEKEKSEATEGGEVEVEEKTRIEKKEKEEEETEQSRLNRKKEKEASEKLKIEKARARRQEQRIKILTCNDAELKVVNSALEATFFCFGKMIPSQEDVMDETSEQEI